MSTVGFWDSVQNKSNGWSLSNASAIQIGAIFSAMSFWAVTASRPVRNMNLMIVSGLTTCVLKLT